MTLTEIRSLVATITGRRDLNVSPYTDLIMYIKEAGRELDRRLDILKVERVKEISVTADDYEVEVDDCMALKTIGFLDSDNAFAWLEKKEIAWLYDEYGEAFSEVDSNTPEYWGVDVELTTDTDYDSRQVVILPPPDEAITLKVWGYFYTPALSDSVTSNYWSTEYPLLLAWMTAKVIAESYAVDEVIAAWEAKIEAKLMQIRAVNIEEEISGVTQMGG